MKNKILTSTIVLACIISALHVFFCIDIYDDIAAYYAPMTRAFTRSNWQDAFFLSVPILNSTLAGCISSFGIEPFRSLVIVSCLFYIASIPVLYYVLKHFLKHDDYAAWGCFLFVVAPKIIRFSCTGLLNPAKNFFIIAALALILSASRKYKWFQPILLGVVFAGLALARAETIIFLPFLGLWYVYFLFRNKEIALEKRLLRILVNGIVILIVFFTCISPRLYQSYKVIGVPVLDFRQAEYLGEMFGVDRKVYKSSLTIVPKTDTKVKNPKLKKGWAGIWKGIECFVRGAYTPYLLLALFGIYLWWKRKEFRPEAFMLFSVIIVNMLVLIFISNSVRYYTINLIMLLPFTFIAIKFIWDLLPGLGKVSFFAEKPKALRAVKILIIIALAIVVVLQIINGARKAISRKYDYEYNIGTSLNKQSGKRLVIATTQPQYPYWADATWMNISDNQIKFLEQYEEIKQGADYIVVRKKQSSLLDILGKDKDFKMLEQKHSKIFVFENTGRGK